MPATKKGKKSIFFVKVRSINDLCRYVYNFDFTSDNIFRGREKLIAFGEHVGSTTIGYYAESADEKSDIIKYTPPSDGNTERIEFLKQGQQGVSWINIINMDLESFIHNKKINSKKIVKIKLKNIEDIAKIVIRKAAKYEFFTHLYSFEINDKFIVCGFELVDKLENEETAFYYVELVEKHVSKFVRYNYTDNKVDFTESVGEHAYMYVKMINLAEPFPFFKA